MPRAGLDRDTVVRGAVTLVDEEGLAALSLARLAERLGVRSPSLYKHIGGLEDLQQGLAVWGVRELGRRLAQAGIGKSGEEAILALADAYRRFAKEHPGIYTMTLRAADPSDKALEAAAVELLGVIKAVLAPYNLDEPTLIHTIRGFRALVHGFVSLELAGGFGMPFDIDTSFAELLHMFTTTLPRP